MPRSSNDRVLQALAFGLLFAAGCGRSLPADTAVGEPGLSVPVVADSDDSVKEVLVRDGQWVERGAVLVRLEPRSTERGGQAARDHLALAGADVARGRLELMAQASAAVAAAYEVRAARSTLAVRRAALQSALGRLKLEQAQLSVAGQQYARAVEQAKQRLITPDEMEERKRSLDVAQQRVTVAEEAIAEARAAMGQSADPSARSQDSSDDPAVKVAEARFAEAIALLGPLVDAQRPPEELLRRACAADFLVQCEKRLAQHPRLIAAEAARRLSEHAAVDAQLHHVAHEIRAPVSGRVSHAAIEPGSHIKRGQTLLVLEEEHAHRESPPAGEVDTSTAASER